MESKSITCSDDDLENSPTFQKLVVLSRLDPINSCNQTEVDQALAQDLITLVRALDNKTIKFENRADEGAFFQLMLTCHTIVSQIRPPSNTKH
ncbi:hypothetical protein [Methylobacter sp.]|uniref:hypothetical protein n=1 Tax=Methylobacter sp. TaxID=2051955 RepID=UPI002FDD7E5B